LKIHRSGEEHVLASDAGCTCVFTIGIDPRSGEVIVVGGRQCDEWPDCQFPLHLAMDAAQEEFDRTAVEPKFNLKTIEFTPDP
jgi:hypothetical protein